MPSGNNHFEFDTIIFLSSVRVEQSSSGPNRLSCANAGSKRVNTRATCHKHVSYGTKCDAIDLAISLSLNSVEWHLSGPDRSSFSSAVKEFMKSRGTCQGAPPSFPPITCPPMVATGPKSLSRIHPMVWPAVLTKWAARGMCHVIPADHSALQLSPSTFVRD